MHLKQTIQSRGSNKRAAGVASAGVAAVVKGQLPALFANGKQIHMRRHRKIWQNNLQHCRYNLGDAARMLELGAGYLLRKRSAGGAILLQMLEEQT